MANNKDNTSPRPAHRWSESGIARLRSTLNRAGWMASEAADAAMRVNAHDDLVAALRPFKELFERIGGEGRSADTTITFKAVDVAPFYAAARDALKKAGQLP